VIKVFVLIEPFQSHIPLTGIKQSLIDRCEILESSLSRDERVCSIESRLIVELDADREPPLLAIWVKCQSDV
jgi:hypothetical protein